MGEYSRRGMLCTGLAALGILATACSDSGKGTSPTSGTTATPFSSAKLTPAAAWSKLKRGNTHWSAGGLQHPDQSTRRRQEVAPAQSPFAVVVSCIDSRVPPEVVFDQGIGDVFSIRTGAQTVDGLVAASIEYGPVENGTPLIVVMGHQRCGAVQATVESIEKKQRLPGRLNEIVDSIQRSYEDATGKGGDIIDQTVRAQTLRTVDDLAVDDTLAPLVKKGALGIAGAYYSLDTGRVSLLKAIGFTPS
jgi:carbonic anhydrase